MEPEEETRSGPETGKDDFEGTSFHTTTIRDRLAHSRPCLAPVPRHLPNPGMGSSGNLAATSS